MHYRVEYVESVTPFAQKFKTHKAAQKFIDKYNGAILAFYSEDTVADTPDSTVWRRVKDFPISRVKG